MDDPFVMVKIHLPKSSKDPIRNMEITFLRRSEMWKKYPHAKLKLDKNIHGFPEYEVK